MQNFMEEGLELSLKESLKRIQEGILTGTSYFGIPALKCPLDAWVYQEIITRQRPDVILEIGNAYGGSTLFFAHLLDLLGHGRVIGIDISHENIAEIVKKHPRIHLMEGNACQLNDQVYTLIEQDEQVLVIEDSSHTFENTLNILRLYSGLVKPGGYFIVEDTICHHGLVTSPELGPYEAVESFLKEDPTFFPDRELEHFFITWNPKGFLKKRSNG
ncbi:MAG: cephalosporin hydroxylase family protein [Bacteroidales bacterium]|jgi:cephalosporin hydroxylase|nr:cephalosporin hydroxylase family protein [Bacteroidales bacterium]